MSGTALCAATIAEINDRLEALATPDETAPARLSEAIRHSLLAPGKRLRPLLTVLIASSDGEPAQGAIDIGCAGEMVHAASLILDDLPCMDDADTRRARPCLHKSFDEATAILAATALLNRAYGVVAATREVTAAAKVEITALLSAAIGETGLIGGQYEDLYAEEMTGRAQIARTYMRKTGALFEYAIMSGAALTAMPDSAKAALRTVSRHLGLAFQIHDDLLDSSAGPLEAMKDTQQDAGKATYVRASGAALRERIAKRKGAALHALSEAGVAAELFGDVVAEQFDLAISRAG